MALSSILLTLVIIPVIISGLAAIIFMVVALIYRMKHPPVPENMSFPTRAEVPDQSPSSDPTSNPEPTNDPAPIETKSFPEILKSHRTARHMSQEYLAEQLGVTRQAVSKWESGASEPSMANLLTLAKLYGISLDELVGLK